MLRTSCGSSSYCLGFSKHIRIENLSEDVFQGVQRNISSSVFDDIKVLFFFSSRRRHTSYWRDWSSDVCSSNLHRAHPRSAIRGRRRHGASPPRPKGQESEKHPDLHALLHCGEPLCTEISRSNLRAVVFASRPRVGRLRLVDEGERPEAPGAGSLGWPAKPESRNRSLIQGRPRLPEITMAPFVNPSRMIAPEDASDAPHPSRMRSMVYGASHLVGRSGSRAGQGKIGVETGALTSGGVEPGATSQVALGQEFNAVGAQTAARPFRAERTLEDVGAYVIRHDRVVVDGEADAAGSGHGAGGGHGRAGTGGFQCVREHINEDAAEQRGVRLEENRLRAGQDGHVLVFRKAERLAGGDGVLDRLQ